ncbi:unnamed protein product [Miscanthus lutarioriparius]|uniref:B box-type domain-containing protein n=1 Tax=Miscanthus lutarioriparius TaxID=422564 RepID=A0A811S3H9_9POAL|nr:unnamed protein product [Miscanthus lutarioriparius]
MGHHHGVCRCELCGAPASVHCAADAAFLCAACDAKVHGANFLASRHRRTRLLDLAAAAGAPAPDEEDGYESAGSSCVSTAESASSSAVAPRRRRRAPAGSGSPSPRLPPCARRWSRRGPSGRASRRLEACAHVPARLVVEVATSLARARRRRAATDAVEGWDECAWAGPKSSPARS